jgi:hypothetical protein
LKPREERQRYNPASYHSGAKNIRIELSDEQHATLKEIKDQRGDTWKAMLLQGWETGPANE